MAQQQQQQPETWTYKVLGLLGQGSCAKVFLAEDCNGCKFAVKCFEKADGEEVVCQARREIASLAKCNHRNIVKLIGVLEDSIDIRLVMEYVEFGELYDFIALRGRLSEYEARPLFTEIVDALAYLHSQGITHRDIKPENILIDSQCHIKLCDFGISNFYDPVHHPLLRTHCGSPHYAAPELIRGQGYEPQAAEVWSLGVLLYAMLCGTLPFLHSNVPCLYQLILSGEYRYPAHIHITDDARALIASMLRVVPTERPTLQAIRNHWWIQQFFSPGFVHPPNEVAELEIVSSVLEACAQAKGIAGAAPPVAGDAPNANVSVNMDGSVIDGQQIAMVPMSQSSSSSSATTAMDALSQQQQQQQQQQQPINMANHQSTGAMSQAYASMMHHQQQYHHQQASSSASHLPQTQSQQQQQQQQLQHPTPISLSALIAGIRLSDLTPQPILVSAQASSQSSSTSPSNLSVPVQSMNMNRLSPESLITSYFAQTAPSLSTSYSAGAFTAGAFTASSSSSSSSAASCSGGRAAHMVGQSVSVAGEVVYSAMPNSQTSLALSHASMPAVASSSASFQSVSRRSLFSFSSSSCAASASSASSASFGLFSASSTSPSSSTDLSASSSSTVVSISTAQSTSSFSSSSSSSSSSSAASADGTASGDQSPTRSSETRGSCGSVSGTSSGNTSQTRSGHVSRVSSNDSRRSNSSSCSNHSHLSSSMYPSLLQARTHAMHSPSTANLLCLMDGDLDLSGISSGAVHQQPSSSHAGSASSASSSSSASSAGYHHTARGRLHRKQSIISQVSSCSPISSLPSFYSPTSSLLSESVLDGHHHHRHHRHHHPIEHHRDSNPSSAASYANEAEDDMRRRSRVESTISSSSSDSMVSASSPSVLSSDKHVSLNNISLNSSLNASPILPSAPPPDRFQPPRLFGASSSTSSTSSSLYLPHPKQHTKPTQSRVPPPVQESVDEEADQSQGSSSRRSSASSRDPSAQSSSSSSSSLSASDTNSHQSAVPASANSSAAQPPQPSIRPPPIQVPKTQPIPMPVVDVNSSALSSGLAKTKVHQVHHNNPLLVLSTSSEEPEDVDIVVFPADQDMATLVLNSSLVKVYPTYFGGEALASPTSVQHVLGKVCSKSDQISSAFSSTVSKSFHKRSFTASSSASSSSSNTVAHRTRHGSAEASMDESVSRPVSMPVPSNSAALMSSKAQSLLSPISPTASSSSSSSSSSSLKGVSPTSPTSPTSAATSALSAQLSMRMVTTSSSAQPSRLSSEDNSVPSLVAPNRAFNPSTLSSRLAAATTASGPNSRMSSEDYVNTRSALTTTSINSYSSSAADSFTDRYLTNASSSSSSSSESSSSSSISVTNASAIKKRLGSPSPSHLHTPFSSSPALSTTLGSLPSPPLFSSPPRTTEAEQERLRFEMFEAAEKGDVDAVRRLLTTGVVDVHSRGIDNWSVLHFAARKGHASIVEEVLQHGGHVILNALTKNSWTPLLMATAQGHMEVADLLIRAGADVTIKNNQGQTFNDVLKLTRARQTLQQAFGT